MLFGETVAVYCENHTEHTDTLCGQTAIYTNPVRTSQETYYVSTTKPNRLMLFRERVAVYCENRTKHTNTLCGQIVVFWCVKEGGTYSNLWASKS
jgi:translation initiation factor IF-1